MKINPNSVDLFFHITKTTTRQSIRKHVPFQECIEVQENVLVPCLTIAFNIRDNIRIVVDDPDIVVKKVETYYLI